VKIVYAANLNGKRIVTVRGVIGGMRLDPHWLRKVLAESCSGYLDGQLDPKVARILDHLDESGNEVRMVGTAPNIGTDIIAE